MSLTKIEWTNYTLNPVKGKCPVGCPYCYARAMYKRFRWNPEIRFNWSVANDLDKMRAGSKVFWGSTFELFGDWVDPEWLRLIFEAVKRHSELTHIFLTKRPEELRKWSPFPKNCWVGMSVDTMSRYGDITDTFQAISASIKFVSFEPILDYTPPDLRYVDWVILGQQTPPKNTTRPKPYQIQGLIDYADIQHIPIFVKNNILNDPKLDALIRNWNRQEFPLFKPTSRKLSPH